jgi:Zn-dependent M32 family carboxypeptidase
MVVTYALHAAWSLGPQELSCRNVTVNPQTLQVRKGLVPLLAELREKGSAPDDSWLQGSYSIDTQAALCKEVALQLGFDTNNGRLDVSVHPFTGEEDVCCSVW